MKYKKMYLYFSEDIIDSYINVKYEKDNEINDKWKKVKFPFEDKLNENNKYTISLCLLDYKNKLKILYSKNSSNYEEAQEVINLINKQFYIYYDKLFKIIDIDFNKLEEKMFSVISDNQTQKIVFYDAIYIN